jgi:hypothetical protein
MKKKTLLFILTPFILISLFIIFVYIASSQSNSEYLGDNIKCNSIPNAKISCEKAYELAKPYLEKSFALKNRNLETIEKETGLHITGQPSDYISQKGNWYYVNRDYALGKSNDFYAGGNTAVRIHKDTGEITEPK